MKKFRGLVSILLALLTLTSLIACATPEEETEEVTTAAAASDTTPVETLSEEELNDPKLDSVEWNGAEFHIIYNGNDLEPNLDFTATETNGSILNDAVYERNTFIADKHKITIVTEYLTDAAILDKVKKSVSTNDGSVQLAEANQNYSMSMGISGYTAAVSSWTNVNTEKVYWNDNLLEGSSIGGKNFFAYSDANVHAFGATPVTIFNKKVHSDFGFDNIYTMVTDGKWTFEKMSAMVKAVTADIDGDGQITKDDRLGMIANTFCIDCFISGTGYMLITKDADGMPVLNYNTEQFTNIIESIQSLLSVENGMYLIDRVDTSTEAREYWTEWAITDDRALFWIGNFKCVERLRSMETDFGVVPMPKLDENQENYAVHMQANIGAAMSIPAGLDNMDDVTTIIEDIAYQSYLKVMPKYMEVLIQGQLVRDVESLESINIIKNSYYCDLGFMLGNYGIAILGTCRSCVSANSAVTSAFKGITKVNEKKIKELVSALTK